VSIFELSGKFFLIHIIFRFETIAPPYFLHIEI